MHAFVRTRPIDAFVRSRLMRTVTFVKSESICSKEQYVPANVKFCAKLHKHSTTGGSAPSHACRYVTVQLQTHLPQKAFCTIGQARHPCCQAWPKTSSAASFYAESSGTISIPEGQTSRLTGAPPCQSRCQMLLKPPPTPAPPLPAPPLPSKPHV